MESNNLSIINLIFEAGIVVQIVMLILALMSIYSWTVIYAKKKILVSANIDIKKFIKVFNAEKDIKNIYKGIDKDLKNTSTIEKVFVSGYEEFQVKGNNSAEMAHRKMFNTMNREVDKLYDNLSSLAVIASSSPYIGLFGTVWGIMNSFIALASVKQASISMVAPGISEALIATAFGLFAAIPATIAYNNLTSEAENINNKYISFIEDLFVNFNKQ